MAPAKFECVICGKSFTKRNSLNRHIRTIHHRESTKCEFCGHTFPRKDSYLRHVISQHQRGSGQVRGESKTFNKAKENKDEEKSQPQTDFSPFENDDEKECASNEKEKEQEQENVNGNLRKFPKDENGHRSRQKQYETRRQIFSGSKSSISAKAPSKYKCELCGTYFTRQSVLDRHVRTVHDGMFTKCELCEQTFSRKDNYLRHLKLKHPQDGGLVREESEKTDNHVSSEIDFLSNKTNNVTKMEKPHPVKGYSDPDNEELLKGITEDEVENINENLRTYSKDENGQRFVQNQCESRLQIASGSTSQLSATAPAEFECEFCGKYFTKRKVLNRHIRTVHEGKSTTCEICGLSFSRKDSYLRHLKFKHQQDDGLVREETTDKTNKANVNDNEEKSETEKCDSSENDLEMECISEEEEVEEEEEEKEDINDNLGNYSIEENGQQSVQKHGSRRQIFAGIDSPPSVKRVEMGNTMKKSCYVKLEPFERIDCSRHHLHGLGKSSSDVKNTHSEDNSKKTHCNEKDRCVQCTIIYVGVKEEGQESNYMGSNYPEIGDKDIMFKMYNYGTNHSHEYQRVRSNDVKKEVFDNYLEENVLEFTIAHNTTANDKRNETMEHEMKTEENGRKVQSMEKRKLYNDDFMSESGKDGCLKKKCSNETGNQSDEIPSFSFDTEFINKQDSKTHDGRPELQAFAHSTTVTRTAKQDTITPQTFNHKSNTSQSLSLTDPIPLIPIPMSQAETLNVPNPTSLISDTVMNKHSSNATNVPDSAFNNSIVLQSPTGNLYYPLSTNTVMDKVPTHSNMMIQPSQLSKIGCTHNLRTGLMLVVPSGISNASIGSNTKHNTLCNVVEHLQQKARVPQSDCSEGGLTETTNVQRGRPIESYQRTIINEDGTPTEIAVVSPVANNKGSCRYSLRKNLKHKNYTEYSDNENTYDESSSDESYEEDSDESDVNDKMKKTNVNKGNDNSLNGCPINASARKDLNLIDVYHKLSQDVNQIPSNNHSSTLSGKEFIQIKQSSSGRERQVSSNGAQCEKKSNELLSQAKTVCSEKQRQALSNGVLCQKKDNEMFSKAKTVCSLKERQTSSNGVLCQKKNNELLSQAKTACSRKQRQDLSIGVLYENKRNEMTVEGSALRNQGLIKTAKTVQQRRKRATKSHSKKGKKSKNNKLTASGSKQDTNYPIDESEEERKMEMLDKEGRALEDKWKYMYGEEDTFEKLSDIHKVWRMCVCDDSEAFRQYTKYVEWNCYMRCIYCNVIFERFAAYLKHSLSGTKCSAKFFHGEGGDRVCFPCNKIGLKKHGWIRHMLQKKSHGGHKCAYIPKLKFLGRVENQGQFTIETHNISVSDIPNVESGIDNETKDATDTEAQRSDEIDLPDGTSRDEKSTTISQDAESLQERTCRERESAAAHDLSQDTEGHSEETSRNEQSSAAYSKDKDNYSGETSQDEQSLTAQNIKTEGTPEGTSRNAAHGEDTEGHSEGTSMDEQSQLDQSGAFFHRIVEREEEWHNTFEPGFQCKACTRATNVFISLFEAVGHIKKTHTNEEETCFKYRLKQQFKGKEIITVKHANKCREGFLCSLCGISYKTVESLRRHLVLVHKDVPPKEFGLEDSSLLCPHCGRTFSIHRKTTYRNHLLIHSDPVTCPKCNQVCKNKATYLRHAKKHRDPIFTCKKCGKTFEERHQYAQHKHKHKVKENGRQFKCEICDKAFMFKHHLITHSVVHSTNRKFACDDCGMTFKLKHHLKNHLERACPKKK